MWSKLFTTAVDQVRRLEAKERKMPKGARWTILKALETSRTDRQEDALQELVESGFATARAFRVKELLRWFRKAETKQAAKWRAIRFLRHAVGYVEDDPVLEPVRKALATFEKHLPASFIVGIHCIPTPVWKVSTAYFRRPEPEREATGT
jgi:hypothetical protein